MPYSESIRVNRKAGAKDRMTFHPGAVPYFTIPMFDALGIRNGYSTKLGGLSTGDYAELNLSPSKEDPDILRENYRRICGALHMDAEKAVLTYQTHTTNVRVVTEEDLGKGPFRARDYIDTDGLVTNLPGVPLVTLSADCDTLYFYDPVHQAIGLSHSGWRGTVNRMGRETLQKMKEAYGTNPEDVYAAVGPSICGDCYEVTTDVSDRFREEFGEEAYRNMVKPVDDRHVLLNLWEANRTVFLQAGIPEDHIFITDVCTKCNPDLLYSHRISGERRGVLGAFLCLPDPQFP